VTRSKWDTRQGRYAYSLFRLEEEMERNECYVWKLFISIQLATIVLEEALAAAREGIFGIGACLVRKETVEVILRGQKKAYKPYFRSDLHAEMDVLTKHEASIKGSGPEMDGLILFSSIEPCPMCLTRIITSGIQVAYPWPRIRTVGWLVSGIKSSSEAGDSKGGYTKKFLSKAKSYFLCVLSILIFALPYCTIIAVKYV